MISGGGKYWAVAGSGMAKATNASPAANRTALTIISAFLVGDLPVAPRDLPTRKPAEEIPSEAAPTHSPIRVARCASERRGAILGHSETRSAQPPEDPSTSLLP